VPPIAYDPIATVQQAITALLRTQEPAFIAIGTACSCRSHDPSGLARHPVDVLLRPAGEQMFGFAKLVLVIAFGYAMITYYETPIPGIGVSFST
jgi:hypothetical protein